MATRNIFLRAGADFSPITKQAKKASGSVVSMMSSINRSTSKLSAAANNVKKLMGAVGIGLSVAGIIRGAKEALEAYQDVEVGQSKLAQVMRNTMAASREEYQSILDLTTAQQKLGVIGDDVQVSGAQELATYLGMSSSLKKLIPVMNDMLAQQYGLNATSENAVNIATMMGKVMNGQVGALSRYGYKFTEAQAAILKYGDEEQRAATLAAVVEESVGGMNAALAATPSGRLQQVKNTLGDINEEFGRAALTIATTFLPLLQKVAQWLSAIAAFANRVAQSIANVFGAKTRSASSTGATGGLGAVENTADGATEALEGTAKAAKKLQAMKWDELNIISSGSESGGAAEEMAALAGNYSGIDWGAAEEGVAGFTGLEKVLERLQGWLERIRKYIDTINFGKITESMPALKSALETIGSIIGRLIEGLVLPCFKALIDVEIPALIQTLNGAASFVSGIMDLLTGLITGDWDLIKKGGIAAGKGLKDIFLGVSKTILGVFYALQNVIDKLKEFSTYWQTHEKDVKSASYVGHGTFLGGNMVMKPKSVTGRATGGLVGSAELFYANENGIPEYIGRMGNSTAVANNEQIAEGISAAVLEAIRGTGLVETVRSIADSSERTARKELSLGAPNSAAGRWIAASVNQYETVRGRI